MDTHQRSFREVVPTVLLVMTIVVFTTLSRAILSPVLFQVEQDFQLSHGPSSQLFLYMSAGFSAALLASGYISVRITHRGTILLSSLVLFFSLIITGMSPNIWILRAGMVMVGTGAGLYPPSGLSVLQNLVVREDRQKALSLHEFGPHIGMLTAPLLANLFLLYGSWRLAYAALGVLTLITGLVFIFRFRSDSSGGQAPSLALLAELFRNPSFLVLIVFFTLALGSIQGIYSLVPLFLVKEGGFEPESANLLFGFSRLSPFMALTAAGFFQDRIGVRASLRIALIGAGICVLLLGVLQGPLLAAAVFLQPAFGALILPAALGAASDIGPEASQNVTVSMLLPIASLLGSGGIPSFIGFMGDNASFSMAFMLLGVMMILGSFLTVFIGTGKVGS